METTVKDEALRVIGELPDSVTMNEIMYRLYVIDSTLHGKSAAGDGAVVSSEQLLREIEQW